MTDTTADHTDSTYSFSVGRYAMVLLALFVLLAGVMAGPALANNHTEEGTATGGSGETIKGTFCSGGLGQLIGFFVTFITLAGVLAAYVLIKADALFAALSGSQQGYEKAKQRASKRIRMVAGLVLFDVIYLMLAQFTPLPGFDCAITSIINL